VPSHETFSEFSDEDILELAFLMSVGEVVGQKETSVLLGKQIHERAVPFAAAIVQERPLAIPRVFPAI
jgi:hypothetical protein